MLDVAHANITGKIIRQTKNEQALAMLSLWRRSLGRFPFVVLAGELHKRNRGVVGGCASDWSSAKLLYELAVRRLGEVAHKSGGFTSCWILFLEEARAQDIESLAAHSQQVEGAA